MSPPLVDRALGQRATYSPVPLVEERPGLWVAVNTTIYVWRPHRLRCFRPQRGAVFVEALLVMPTVSNGLDISRRLPLLSGQLAREVACSYFDIEQKDPHFDRGLLAEPLSYWHPGERLTLDVRGEVERIVMLCKRDGSS